MRVLLVTYWVQPRPGGIHSYVTSLKAGLESLGHQIDVLAKVIASRVGGIPETPATQGAPGTPRPARRTSPSP